MTAAVVLREEQHEQQAREAGAKKVRDRVIKAQQKGLGAETPGGVGLVKRAIGPLSQAIKAALDDAKSGRAGRRHVAMRTLDLLAPEVSAYLATRVAVSSAILRRSLTNTAVQIGSAIEEELRLAAFEEQQGGLYNTIMRRMKERGASAGHARRVFVFAANKASVELPKLTQTEKLHLGTRLVEMLVEVTGFIEIITVRSGNKTKLIVRPTDVAEKWIKDRDARAELLSPLAAPMVAPPKDWEGTAGGGYFTYPVAQMPLVKACNHRRHKELLESADLSIVLRGLNAIQRTAWRINTKVLDVMAEVWDRDLQIAMPNKHDRELPSKPTGFDPGAKGKAAWANVPDEKRQAYRSEARRIHEENAATRGKRVQIAQALQVATELRDEPAIYFPHQLDFRGRGYAVPASLNPQSSDQAKALLTFAADKGKPIETPRAAGWLAIHGANMFGFDKADFADRIAWVQEREEQIKYTASEPLGDLWWTDADKPWCFLAWCFEYAAFLEHGYGYVSSLPLAVDGSCNGLQHFSAMLRDPIGGAAVNLTPNALPADIYQKVADRVIWKLEQAKDEWQNRSWLDFGINRKITKRPVMVLPYGGTFRSCMQYVAEAVHEKIAGGTENPFGDELRPNINLLARMVWDSIGDVVVAARQAMDWLQKVARICTKHGHPLIWTTPSGFPVYQSYMDLTHRRVKTRLQGSIVFLSTQEETDTIDGSKQALAVSPNFVHSLDAAAMMLTIDLALDNGVEQFAMIHDSYGTVAADMDMLSACLRHAFVDMYTDHHVLAELLAGLPEEVRAECPPPPPLGTLDIKEVLESEFFFA